MADKKEENDNITETLASVQSDLDKITKANNELEAALLKNEELKARIMREGKGIAGEEEKNPQQLAAEEAKKVLAVFGK